jgi:two-component system response regulator YesN
MWRAILVDDEQYVRMELKRLFPWNRYQFDLVGEAENGRTAIDLIEAVKPDLVITDIRMPVMDGLELIAWIGGNYPQVVAAVVSAYNDFPFVREALRLGAVDYLMKAEANFKTAGTFLERIGGILDHRYSAQSRQKELAANMACYQRLATDSFWRDALTRAFDEAEIDIRAHQLGITLEHLRFGLIFIHVSNYQTRWGENQHVFHMALEEEIRANWDFSWDWNLIDCKRGDFIIITSGISEIFGPETGVIQKLAEIAGRLALDATEKRTTSVSPQLCSFADLHKSFREVREINLLRLYHQEGRYLEADHLLRLRQATPPKTAELLATWEQILQGMEPVMIRDFLESVFQNILPRCFGPDEARRLALDLINTLRRVALEHQIRLAGNETGGREPEPLEILEHAETVSDWQIRIEKLACHYLQCAKTSCSPPVSLPIRKALEYIQANFTRALSLGEVAGYAGVSKSYLSRVFPEYTGEHFSNYLQRLRIERAKELLKLTDDCIYEVAAKVGFWNSRYFSTVFHDMVGMTPADYRRVTSL